MIMMMMRFQFLQTPIPNLLALLLLTIIALATSQYDCHDNCGNIPIPFPFGTTLQCYHSHPFRVTCNRTFEPPKLFWGNSSIEIISISLLGQMTIMQHVSYNCDCGNGNKVSSPGSKLQLPEPFTVNNTANKFTIVGHDAYGFVYGPQQSGQQYSAGCMTMRYSVSDLEEGSCMGLGCCQTSIPKNVSGVNIYLNIERNNTTRIGVTSNCTYGFLVEESAFNFSRKSVADLKDVKMLPMVVDWAVGLNRTCQEARKRTSEYACTSENSRCYMPENGNGYRCLCRNGYDGNPYSTHGCYHQDDEGAIDPLLLAFGIICGTIYLLFWAWMWSHAAIHAIKANRRYTFYKRNGGLLLEQHISSTENGLHKTKVFPSKELAQATDHYNENRILGRGGQGTVYKGMLTDGKIVAVKKSRKVNEGDVEVFINEVVILSQINHRNIVNLIGCCLETEVPLLVYEFIPNGTLFHHIHEPSEEIPLTWEMRVRIATEVAGALSYLHSASSTPIYHRDIKSTNILLDDKYRAKVSDFGTSRSVAIDQTHLTTRVLGTFGYLDPEYFQSSQFTEKSDVYSFGVVMVELLTGEEAVTSVRAESGKNLATHFLHTVKDSKLFDILDARVLKEGKTKDIVAMAEIARRCLNMNGRKRPTMKEVAVDLEGIRRELLKEGRVSPQRNHQNIDMNREIEISNESYDISLTFSSTYTDSIIGDSREPKSHLHHWESY